MGAPHPACRSTNIPGKRRRGGGDRCHSRASQTRFAGAPAARSRRSPTCTRTWSVVRQLVSQSVRLSVFLVTQHHATLHCDPDRSAVAPAMEQQSDVRSSCRHTSDSLRESVVCSSAECV